MKNGVAADDTLVNGLPPVSEPEIVEDLTIDLTNLKLDKVSGIDIMQQSIQGLLEDFPENSKMVTVSEDTVEQASLNWKNQKDQIQKRIPDSRRLIIAEWEKKIPSGPKDEDGRAEAQKFYINEKEKATNLISLYKEKNPKGEEILPSEANQLIKKFTELSLELQREYVDTGLAPRPKNERTYQETWGFTSTKNDVYKNNKKMASDHLEQRVKTQKGVIGPQHYPLGREISNTDMLPPIGPQDYPLGREMLPPHTPQKQWKEVDAKKKPIMIKGQNWKMSDNVDYQPPVLASKMAPFPKQIKEECSIPAAKDRAWTNEQGVVSQFNTLVHYRHKLQLAETLLKGQKRLMIAEEQNATRKFLRTRNAI